MDLFKHKCPFCGNYFAKKNCISRHIESIHEGKTFQCQHCEQKFAYRGSLKRHIQSIHGGKIYKCQHCESQETHTVY